MLVRSLPTKKNKTKQNNKKMARDVFDSFAADSGLVHDVTAEYMYHMAAFMVVFSTFKR